MPILKEIMNGFMRLRSFLSKISGGILFVMLIWGCGRVPHLAEAPPPVSRLPFVRVLINNNENSHTFASPQKDEMAIDCYRDDKRVSFYSRKPVRVIAEGDQLDLHDDEGRPLDIGFKEIVISTRGKKQMLAFDGKPYRGLFQATAASGQIILVNIAYVEDYLRGVVPLEFGPVGENHVEAIKAQAVAARTYAMKHLGQYSGMGYDLKADIMDQVYNGAAPETPAVDSAVEVTRGQIAIYKGDMISAYYHSTCGGRTDDIEDVWEKDPAPYLVSVSDDSACAISKYFSWKESFTADQLTLRLEQYLSRERGDRIDVGRLIDVRITARTPGGRVASIVFETGNGHYVFNKEKVRWVVGRSEDPTQILRSAAFTIDVTKNEYGEVSRVTFEGRGWGHGVGMCQMGAKGLAEQGIGYDSILKRYYQGTALKSLY